MLGTPSGRLNRGFTDRSDDALGPLSIDEVTSASAAALGGPVA